MAPKITGFKLSPFWSKPSLKEATKAQETKTFAEQTGLGQNTVDRASLDLQSPYAGLVKINRMKSVEDIAADVARAEFPQLKPLTPEVAKGITQEYTNLALRLCPEYYAQDLVENNPATAERAEVFMNNFEKAVFG